MDVVVYIRGDAEGLNELAGQLKTAGIKCLPARQRLDFFRVFFGRIILPGRPQSKEQT
jgi:hypothetical protein